MPSPRHHSLQIFRRSVAIILQSAPVELRLLTFLTLISGLAPSAVLFLNKIIIDEAAALIKRGDATSSFDIIWHDPRLLWSVVGIILLNLLTNSVNTIISLTVCSLRDRVQGFTKGKILKKIARFNDISLFETPELLNLIELAKKGIDRIKELSFILVSTLNGIFIFIPAVLLSGAIAGWIPLLLFTTAAPSIYYELIYREKSWIVEETQASLQRKMDLYQTVLTDESYAKEIRLFNLQELFINRWQKIFNQIFKAMQRIRYQGTMLIMAWSILGGLGVAVPFVYVLMGTLQGRYGLGDLALYAGLILQVRQSLFMLIDNGSSLYDVVLGTKPIFQLLDLQPKLSSFSPSEDLSETTQSRSNRHLRGIEIQDLYFSYPGSESQILENINLTIQPQEIIALVGENGAGKTTLTKLLCRLYDPDQGKILWQGKDLRDFDPDELHSKIAVVMQDYAKFPATIRENIGFGYLSLIKDSTAIKSVLERVGMGYVLEDNPQGLETPLDRALEDGIELSEGQWQRIAIARALLRLSTAEFLIFDEPTAALDANTEYDIYQMFRKLATDKMTIVISHRLALCKLADRIVVLEKGKIIELGSHEELMAMGGQYHLMFTRQASSYY